MKITLKDLVGSDKEFFHHYDDVETVELTREQIISIWEILKINK